jgi:hypothetical protein
MVSSGLLRRVALVRTTRRNNPEDTILHSHRRENLKSYIIIIIIIIITGMTALCEPWPSSELFAILLYCRSIQLLLLWISKQFNVYGVRLLASRLTPNLEGQCIPLRLAPTP